MAKSSKLKVGEVLSESQFYVVEKVQGNKVQLKPDSGDSITVSDGYVEQFLTSGEQVESPEVKVSRTELATLFLANANVAMQASFNKQVKEVDVTKEIMNTYQNSTPSVFEKAVKAAVKKGLDGEERIITGYHTGNVNEFGRVNFVDMKLARDTTKNFDNRLRQVDPRTLNFVLLRGTKHIVK